MTLNVQPKDGNSRNMSTEELDEEQLKANVCPVCAVLAGGPDSRQPRHALLMHIRRHAQNDDRHRLWSDLNYAAPALTRSRMMATSPSAAAMDSGVCRDVMAAPLRINSLTSSAFLLRMHCTRGVQL
jgi:hypothetical protein